MATDDETKQDEPLLVAGRGRVGSNRRLRGLIHTMAVGAVPWLQAVS